ncbi:class I SAM-dependent methyltransferase [Desulfobulbus alkaliphilus]|uniref:class I SAM-dependent methyltransferase n=1 Tax=Desulfobulbus alkaliphilus TaxID=869814 RepID=UPI001966A8EE|nr:class I SAM-dependent methyltransferase [Desulfobulbus alkaliphilus]MBM9537369.1 class I SAM-dependent methyltransferase [Desulfobulbus alkaliphilus]
MKILGETMSNPYHSLLTDWGYRLSSKTDVFSRLGYEGIGYSDGERLEEDLLTTLKNITDLSVLSPEIRNACNDWVTTYHLSPERSNILRPFAQFLTSVNILELGAGCGAITRFLGESGGNVIALEGAPARAAIARTRVQDLPNVAVIAEKILDFKPDFKFDVITLIGVLEYAGKYSTIKDPVQGLLEHCRSLLKEDGFLIIAIENQLGLKYFAGAPEDHVGKPVFGIEGWYQSCDVETFGKQVLTRFLASSSFPGLHFFAPFPDYKLPVSIVSETAFSKPHFDGSAFAWQAVRQDRQLPSVCNFSQELIWPTLELNGLMMEMANSFLIVASSLAGIERLNQGVDGFAWHYSCSRKPQYCKKTVFKCPDKLHENTISVETFPLSLEQEPLAGGLLNHTISQRNSYVLGTLLAFDFTKIVTNEFWEFSDIARFFRNYLKHLSFVSQSQFAKIDWADMNSQLPGVMFDWMPKNVIVDSEGVPRVIDQEWSINREISLGYLVFRACYTLVVSVSCFGAGPRFYNGWRTPRKFFLLLAESLNWDMREDNLESYIRLEVAVQEYITGNKKDADFRSWFNSASLITTSVYNRVQNLELEIQRLLKLQKEIIQQQNSTQETLNILTNTLSWRLTAPIRRLRHFQQRFSSYLSSLFQKE